MPYAAAQAWTGLQQEQVDRVLERITSSRKNVRLAQHAQSLLQHMLQVGGHALSGRGSPLLYQDWVLFGTRCVLGLQTDRSTGHPCIVTYPSTGTQSLLLHAAHGAA